MASHSRKRVHFCLEDCEAFPVCADVGFSPSSDLARSFDLCRCFSIKSIHDDFDVPVPGAAVIGVNVVAAFGYPGRTF